jgi:hypothetical protein
VRRDDLRADELDEEDGRQDEGRERQERAQLAEHRAEGRADDGTHVDHRTDVAARAAPDGATGRLAAMGTLVGRSGDRFGAESARLGRGTWRCAYWGAIDGRNVVCQSRQRVRGGDRRPGNDHYLAATRTLAALSGELIGYVDGLGTGGAIEGYRHGASLDMVLE